ncbi:MAG: zf-HC2 domain-containing protein [Planctomycetes bacterium]|nr:zf-HC2 domain-containing protein [Planctomycetota bacterium]
MDDELSPTDAQRLRAHLAECDSCSGEVASLRELAAAIADGPASQVPPTLWTAIDRRLSEQASDTVSPIHRKRVVPVMRIAAVIALVVGLGGLAFVVRQGESTAHASTIDFGVILDALPLDPQKAFSRFLTLYSGVEISLGQARSFAPDLDFEVPAMLPGGFSGRTRMGCDSKVQTPASRRATTIRRVARGNLPSDGSPGAIRHIRIILVSSAITTGTRWRLAIGALST